MLTFANTPAFLASFFFLLFSFFFPGSHSHRYISKPWPTDDICPPMYQDKVKCVEFGGKLSVLKIYNLSMPTARRQLIRSVRNFSLFFLILFILLTDL